MTPSIDSPGKSGVVKLGGSGVAVPHTGDTNDFVFATIPVPAGVMGPNGILRITTFWSCTNNANGKTGRTRFSGAGGTIFQSIGLNSIATMRAGGEIANRGALNSQVGSTSTGWGSSSNAPVTAAVDTSVDQTVTITGQLTVGTDTLTLEYYLVEVLPG